jgi:hypothetical protein
MVRVTVAALLDFLAKNTVTLLELIGIACIILLVALVAGPVWMLCPAGVAALLKSAELDAKRRPSRGDR